MTCGINIRGMLPVGRWLDEPERCPFCGTRVSSLFALRGVEVCGACWLDFAPYTEEHAA